MRGFTSGKHGAHLHQCPGRRALGGFHSSSSFTASINLQISTQAHPPSEHPRAHSEPTPSLPHTPYTSSNLPNKHMHPTAFMTASAQSLFKRLLASSGHGYVVQTNDQHSMRPPSSSINAATYLPPYEPSPGRSPRICVCAAQCTVLHTNPWQCTLSRADRPRIRWFVWRERNVTCRI